MRIIKQRAWDSDNKQYWYSETHSAGSWGDFVLSDAKNWNEEDWDARFIIEDFIGFKDKKGNDIYEGDLVTFKCPQCDFEHKGVIVWHFGGCWGIITDQGPDPVPIQQPINPKDFEEGLTILEFQEVTGNIHDRRKKEA